MRRLCVFIAGAWMFAHTIAGGSTLPGFRFVFPVPDAHFASPSTSIIVRPDDPSVLTHISPPAVSASGSRSGKHAGRLILSDDRKTLIFAPFSPFSTGEEVTVTLDGSLVGKTARKSQYHFRVSPREQRQTRQLTISPSPFARRRPGAIQPEVPAMQIQKNAHASQTYEPPAITVDVNTTPSEGCVFLSSFSVIDSSSPFLLIVDNSGNLVFSQERSAVCYDFRVQPNGLITYFDTGRGYYVALDNNFVEVDSFMCGNGVLTTDEHELILLNDGHALLMGRVDIPVDMSALVEGGQPEAIIIGLVVQELDQSRNVVFQWNSWDHYAVTDADADIDLTLNTIDCVHGNSVELDYDGNLIISSRNMDEITKIDRQTGDIIWRLGGEQNQFTFVNDSLRFTWQHDARRLPNGHITVFDNGVDHDPLFSRVIEYELDEVNRTATLVWEYRADGFYSYYMGNAQRLPNGNTMIGWGGTTGASVTEVTPDGAKVWEITLPPAVYSYRAFRFPCVTPPQVWALTAAATHGRVMKEPDYAAYANGATVQLTAIPDRGYAFVGWSGDAEGNTNPLPITMDGSKTVQADFAAAINTVSVDDGWNLVSVPVIPDDPGISSCFPNAISQAFRFDAGYKEATEVNVGTGYWLKCSGGNTFGIAGNLLGSGEIAVTPGWNMIGPCEQEIATAAITSDPPGITISPYYGYADGYRDVTRLSPGRGYWIKVSDGGTLRVVGGTAKVSTTETQSVSRWATLEFEDARGRSGVLRLAPSGEKGRSLELPPLPPAGIPDLRFGSGTWAETVDLKQHEILLQGMEFPVTVRAFNLDHKALILRDAIDGSLFNVLVEEGTAAVISRKLERLMLVDDGGSGALPTSCALFQNYPNPFNPNSDIRYHLPALSNSERQAGISEFRHVDLVVYDLLGREVTVLVNEMKKPGVYTVRFDAGSLASGIYIYQMRVGSFVDTKKLILLR